MDLVRKGRLSVQRVAENAWTAIGQLAEEGGWEEMNLKPKKRKVEAPTSKKAAKGARKKPAGRPAANGNPKEDEVDGEEGEGEPSEGEEDVKAAKGARTKPVGRRAVKGKQQENEEVSTEGEDDDSIYEEEEWEGADALKTVGSNKSRKGRKRKARGEPDGEYSPRRRTRAKR